MSNSQLDDALRERWEKVYQNLFELYLLYAVYLPISAGDMLKGEYVLPEGYTIREEEQLVVDVSGRPQPFYTEQLLKCIRRKGALAAARALVSVLRNESATGVIDNPDSFVQHFVHWQYRYFG
jgi:hypothetical protein